MPTYDIQNKKTGEVKEIFCSYNDREKALKKEGKDWEYLVGAPALQHAVGKSVLRTGNAGSGWNDHLNRIKQNSGKDNTIRTR